VCASYASSLEKARERHGEVRAEEETATLMGDCLRDFHAEAATHTQQVMAT